MLSENRVERNQMEMICIDDFVPEGHLLRKIEEEEAIDKVFEWILSEVEKHGYQPLFYTVFIRILFQNSVLA